METHKHTHTLNLDLTWQVCYAISLQYFTKKKKNINSAPQQGAGSFHVCRWRICERALHPIMRVEATDTWKSGRAGRRGGDLYFWRRYSHGVPGERAAVGSPPQMAAQEKPARDRAGEDVIHRRVNMTISDFGALEVRCVRYKWANPSGRDVGSGVGSVLMLPFALKTEWPPLIYSSLAVEHHGTKCNQKKRGGGEEEEVSPFLQHPGLFCCCDNNKDKRRQPWTPDSFVSITTLKAVSLTALTSTSQPFRLWRTDRKYLWSNCLNAES